MEPEAVRGTRATELRSEHRYPPHPWKQSLQHPAAPTTSGSPSRSYCDSLSPRKLLCLWMAGT